MTLDQLYIHYFRDAQGLEACYNAISVIEFQGSINSSGNSNGHYICDIQEKATNQWFRTNDNSNPVPIQQDQVTKKAYVVLLKRRDQ